MSGSSILTLAAVSIRTARIKGNGRPVWRLAVHMNPATPQVCQAAVTRGSVRESQLLPSGPGALYAPPSHGVTAMSLNDTALALSRQVKSRSDEPELWLPKYITSRSPKVQRSEPFAVVEKKLYDIAPPLASRSSGMRKTTARRQVFVAPSYA